MNKRLGSREALELLSKIKEIVKQNHMKIPVEKEKDVDAKILNAINSVLCEENEIDVLEFFSSKGSEKARKILCNLAYRYAALCNDNEELFSELLDNGFDIGNSEYILNLGVLDRRISDKFAKDNYIKLVKEQGRSFGSFYEMLSFDDKINPDEFYINKFTDIMNNASNTPFEGLNSFEILSALNYLYNEAILCATDEQRKTIFPALRYYNDEMSSNDIKKLNEIIKDTDVCIGISSWWDFFEEQDKKSKCL